MKLPLNTWLIYLVLMSFSSLLHSATSFHQHFHHSTHNYTFIRERLNLCQHAQLQRQEQRHQHPGDYQLHFPSLNTSLETNSSLLGQSLLCPGLWQRRFQLQLLPLLQHVRSHPRIPFLLYFFDTKICRDGSYYYSNSNGSTYHNNGKGSATYTSPSGGRSSAGSGGSSSNSRK